ncbi:MAG: multiple sugar transport system permease protein [Actinomycetota bacterium]|nr:multiple sugar transport system permease protein [Actinomycetota bacterium]
MLAFLAYFLFPLFWLVVASTKQSSDLFSTFGLWFADDFHFFQNVRDLFALRTLDGGTYVVWLRNSVLYSVTSAVLAGLTATAAGYGYAKFAFRGRELVFWFILGSVMVPTQALAVPTWLLFAEVDLTNNPLSIILPCSVSPFGVYLMRIYAERAVDSDLIEAARLDGAGELRIFRSIAFRLLMPGFVTVTLFAFVQTWNNYLLPLLMLSESKWYPLTVGLTQIGNLGAIVGSLIAIVPMIVAFVFLQRFWQSGLAAGATR